MKNPVPWYSPAEHKPEHLRHVLIRSKSGQYHIAFYDEENECWSLNHTPHVPIQAGISHWQHLQEPKGWDVPPEQED
jgi:hypothetical protein